MTAQNDAIKIAIEATQEERNRLIEEITRAEKDLEARRNRLSSLDGFIEQGKLLLGMEVVASPSSIRTSIESIPSEDESLVGKSVVAAGAVKIFREMKRALKPKTIADEFHRRGWPLSASGGTEVIRLAMKKRPKLFVKHKDGSFSLREQ